MFVLLLHEVDELVLALNYGLVSQLDPAEKDLAAGIGS